MSKETNRDFKITVLGRTLEHLGTQMYKRRDVAIAELVANSWDAGATVVRISIPSSAEYDNENSSVVVTDNGLGMSADEVADHYLVIGRNRRSDNQKAPNNRRIMGRKGVGKLAGFGLGKTMSIRTWRDNMETLVTLDGQKLKSEGGSPKELNLDGIVRPVTTQPECRSGTEVTLSRLKHKTPPDIDKLHAALSRRYSRSVLGSMRIYINDEPLNEPNIDFTLRYPDTGENQETLAEDQQITWWAGFSKTVLPSELQGFTILVNGKTAQAPPYFFDVEATASGQHGTKYLTGVIEADFLDSGIDDDSDRISTDRQEIDWDVESTLLLKQFGDGLTRRLLRERADARGDQAERDILQNTDFARRLSVLDTPSRKKAKAFIRSIGRSSAPDEKISQLADTIIQAFEYQQFHDYVSDLDSAAADPDKLAQTVAHMHEWRTLESRALLEVIKGRIEIIDKFFDMIINNSAEVAPRKGEDNLHDLIASYPWILNPDWQVFAEERTLSAQLREWGHSHSGAADKSRYDFLALSSEKETIVIEIKRSGHPVLLEDLQQLERYVNSLSEGKDGVRGAFITGSRYALNETTLETWRQRQDIDILTWREIHERTERHYRHYRAILDRALRDRSFTDRATEVALTRDIVAKESTYRGPDRRKAGLGAQDNYFQ